MATLLPGCRRSPAPAAPVSLAPKPVVSAAPVVPAKPVSPLANLTPEADQFLGSQPDAKMVAMTFDAGADDEAVPLLVKTLTERHLKCTFFLTGAFCKRFPEKCKMIADAGMELGNHSFHHPKFTTKSAEQIHEELTTAEAEIEKACRRGAKPLFRYPYGDSDKRVRAIVAKEGYQGISWSVDSLDSVGQPKDAEFVIQRIEKKLKPGGITLMHVSRIESAKSLPTIIDWLDAQGVKVVPVSELLEAYLHEKELKRSMTKSKK